MTFCTNCGKDLKENDKFCPECGAPRPEAQAKAENAEAPYIPPIVDIPITGAAATSTPEAPVYGTPKTRSLNVGLLVWSLINLILCCMPLGIASLVMTIVAKDATTDEEEAKKLKTAKVCNLIGTIGSIVFYVVYVVVIILVALFDASAK